MAKIEKASEDVVNLFDEIREGSNIPTWIEFEVLANNKQKELYKIVKTNDIVELISDGINFAIVFNENILDKLPRDLQELAISECLAGVSVNDSDVVSLDKPNFNTHTGVLKKYGHEPIIRLKECIKSLYDSQKEEEDRIKSDKKLKKIKKSKF